MTFDARRDGMPLDKEDDKRCSTADCFNKLAMMRCSFILFTVCPRLIFSN